MTVNNQATLQKGIERRFVTPPLSGQGAYTAEFNARWQANGQEVRQSRTVTAGPGDKLTVDFTRPERERLPRPEPAPEPERVPEPRPVPAPKPNRGFRPFGQRCYRLVRTQVTPGERGVSTP